MAFKFVLLAAFVAVASAGAIPSAAPSYEADESSVVATKVATPVVTKVTKVTPVAVKKGEEDYDHNPQYSYGYDVQDGLTGDNKQHHETRNGDVVEGSYSLVEADGSRRTVHYTADSVNGFNAVVDKQAPEQQAIAKFPGPVVAKATPVVKSPAPAPVAYANYEAPVAYSSYQPPVTYTNYAPQPIAYHHGYLAQPAVTKVAAPVAPVVTKVAAPVSYHHNYEAPAVSYNTYPTHVYAHQPVHHPVAQYQYPAPALTKIAAPIAYHHGYAAPTVTKVSAPIAYAGYAPSHYQHQMSYDYPAYYN